MVPATFSLLEGLNVYTTDASAFSRPTALLDAIVEHPAHGNSSLVGSIFIGAQ